MTEGMDEATKKLFLGKRSKLRNIQRGLYTHRHQFIPHTPETMEAFEADHEWLKITRKGVKTKENLIKGDKPVPGGRVLIMSTDESLRRFARATAFCVDGTFKLAPRLWYQLIIITAQIGPTTWVPVAFGYLPNKKKKTYSAFFNGLKDYMKKIGIKDGEVAADYCMADWEIGTHRISVHDGVCIRGG